MRVAAIVSALVLSAQPASATFFSGNDLHDLCERSRPIASGFVAGAYDAAEAANAALANYFIAVDPLLPKSDDKRKNMIIYSEQIEATQGFCVPKEATLSQLTDVLCQYLAQTPNGRHLTARVNFNRALAKAWPCPK